MWLRTIFRRQNRRGGPARPTELDEQFLRRLERLTLYASRQLRGGISGAHPSLRRLPAPIFSDHRAYSSGDDPRYVDWNAYARLDHLQVKLGEAEQDVRVHLVVDCSLSMDYGAGDRNKLHYARLLGAAIGYIALATGDRLQVLPMGSDEFRIWGPAGGRQRAPGLIQYLQSLHADGNHTLARTLQGLVRSERGGLVVIISDLWHSPDLESTLAMFQPPRWQVVLLHLLHPEELYPELSGDIELVDSEQGTRLSVQLAPSELGRYTDAAERWCEAIEQTLARYNMRYLRLVTDIPFERAALSYLRVRKVLQ